MKSTPWSTSFENTFGMSSRSKIRKAWSSDSRITTFGPVAATVGPDVAGGDGLGPASFEPVQVVARRARTIAAGPVRRLVRTTGGLY